MAFKRSIRDYTADEEPLKSVLDALLPDPDESPFTGEVDWDSATEEQLRLISMSPVLQALLGGTGPATEIPTDEPAAAMEAN